MAELRKGEVSSGDTQKSEVRKTQKAIRTLEYKLDRVSHASYYHKIPRKQTDPLILSCRSYIVVLCPFFKCISSHIIIFYCIILKFACAVCPVQSLTRFNEQLTKNSHLREELQTLHIERVRFQQLHNRLDKVRGHTIRDSETIFDTGF